MPKSYVRTITQLYVAAVFGLSCSSADFTFVWAKSAGSAVRIQARKRCNINSTRPSSTLQQTLPAWRIKYNYVTTVSSSWWVDLGKYNMPRRYFHPFPSASLRSLYEAITEITLSTYPISWDQIIGRVRALKGGSGSLSRNQGYTYFGYLTGLVLVNQRTQFGWVSTTLGWS